MERRDKFKEYCQTNNKRLGSSSRGLVRQEEIVGGKWGGGILRFIRLYLFACLFVLIKRVITSFPNIWK